LQAANAIGSDSSIRRLGKSAEAIFWAGEWQIQYSIQTTRNTDELL
jgi:hypothetical protein